MADGARRRCAARAARPGVGGAAARRARPRARRALWASGRASSGSATRPAWLGRSTSNDRRCRTCTTSSATLFEPSRRNGPLLIDMLLDAALFTAKEAPSASRSARSFGFALGVVLAHSRLLQRGLLPYIVASQTIPILAIAPMVVVWVNPRLPAGSADWVRGRGDRRLPHLLPGHDQHAARPALGRPARARADALLRREQLGGALEAPRPGLAAVPLRGAQDRGDRERRRRDHRRAARLDPGGLGGAILNFNQYYVARPTSLWATNLIAALLGITFFLVVVLAEKLVVRRAPEHVA